MKERQISRRGVVGALGSTAGLIALGCAATPAEDETASEPLGRTQQALDSSLLGYGGILDSGLHPTSTPWAVFASLISSTYSMYELRLRNVYPSTVSGSAFLALQLSGNNGSTWDNASCGPSCYYNGHYSYTTMFTCPGSTTLYSRNSQNSNAGSSPGMYDQQIALTQQDAHVTGVCGVVRMFGPTVPGVFKQFEWDVSYFGPNNFCRESGSAIYYGASPLNGSAYNAFRLGYTDANGNFASNFGGGGYALSAWT